MRARSFVLDGTVLRYDTVDVPDGPSANDAHVGDDGGDMEERIAQLIAFTGTSREQALTCLQGASYALPATPFFLRPAMIAPCCAAQLDARVCSNGRGRAGCGQHGPCRLIIDGCALYPRSSMHLNRRTGTSSIRLTHVTR